MVSSDMSVLLDQLKFLAGCTYISDLRVTRNASSIRSALKKVDPSSFTPEAWNNAVRYITGKVCQESAPAGALCFLDTWLASLDKKKTK